MFINIVEMVDDPKAVIPVSGRCVRLESPDDCLCPRVDTADSLCQFPGCGRTIPEDGELRTLSLTPVKRGTFAADGQLIGQVIQACPEIEENVANIQAPILGAGVDMNADDILACLRIEVRVGRVWVNFLPPLNRRLQAFKTLFCTSKFK